MEQYRSLFENAGIELFISGADAIILHANRRFITFSGLSRDDIEGKKKWTDFIHPDDREQVAAGLPDPGGAGFRDFSCEFRFIAGSGEISDVILKLDPLQEPDRYVGVLIDITSRKKGETALREGREKMANAMELAQLANWELDIATGIFSFDDRFYSLYGTSAEREGGTRMPAEEYMHEFVHPDDTGIVSSEISNSLEGSSFLVPQVEHRIIRRDGEVRQIVVRRRPILDDRGTLVKVFGANQDITERRIIEGRISGLNTAFLAFSPDPLHNINVLTRVAGEMLGGKRAVYNRLEDGLLCSLGTWNTPPDHPVRDRPDGHVCNDVISAGGIAPTIIPDLLQSGYAETDPYVRKFQHRGYIGVPVKIGERVLGSLSVTYAEPCNPTPQDLVIITILAKAIAIEDERRTSVLALHASEERYRTLAENAPIGIITCDRHGNITFINPKMLKMLGSPSEAVTRQINLLTFPPLVSSGFSNALEQSLASSSPTDLFEMEYESFWGKTVYYRGYISSLAGDRFEPGALIILDDTTERKQAEDALKLANKKLNLLTGINRHDIGNQLTALDSFARLSERSLDDPAELATLIEVEKTIIDTMIRLVTFTRDYENLGVNAPVWTNIRDLVQEVASDLPGNDIRITYTGTTGLEIYADPLLFRVFFNLLENAIRHGGEQLTYIRVTDRQEEGTCIITIEDDGVGIGQEEKTRLFTRGYGKHTGFGLFFSREILLITGISIRETGEPGKGARFELIVPPNACRISPCGC